MATTVRSGCCDRLHLAASALALAVVVAFATWMVVANGSFWLWVAESALRGRRGPRDIGLGIRSVASAVAPVAAAATAWWWNRQQGTTRMGSALLAAAYAALVAMPLVCAAVASTII